MNLKIHHHRGGVHQTHTMAVSEIGYELRNRRAVVQEGVQSTGALFVYPPETQATE